MASTLSQYFTPLTERKKLYLQGLAKGMNRTQAARFAGFSKLTRPSDIETPSVKAAFAKLIRVSASPEKIASVIRDGLDATRTISAAVPKDAEPETVEVPDFKERREYAKLAAEWAGYVEADKGAPAANVAVGITLINGVTNPKRGQNGE